MRSVYSINKGWIFQKDTTDVPSNMPRSGEAVDLPHTWNASDGQDGGNDYFRGSCVYSRQLNKSELPKADKYYLEINGANSSADVYVNGKRLAHHDGGYSTFRVNIGNILREQNCIAILVDNSANEHVYPQTADFTFYGGLYRDVNIIAVADTHFALERNGTRGIFVTPEITGSNAEIKIRTEVVDICEGDEILLEIRDAEGVTVVTAKTRERECRLSVSNVHLWHGVKDPYLYTAVASIIRCGREIDRVEARFGCRSYVIDPDRGFILNGEEYPLRGVSRHQDRGKIGNALLAEHHEEDMQLIREVGANTVRLAHYQHDSYFYDLCDQYGMAVWAEIPYISRHMQAGNENAMQQMRELITQCYNHPSIIVWGLSNEITMDGASDPDLIKQHKRLNELAHSMDSTRPTVIACLSICDTDEEYVHIPDAVSYNHYFGWYGGSFDQYGPWLDNFHQRYPNTPIGISEYGCEALNWHSSNPQAGDYSEEYQAMYHEALIKQLFSRKYLWATHVWNMFDFGADARAEGGENGQNHKGLVTIDRKYKKDAFYAYKAWWSNEPFVHICGKRYVDRVEDITRVTVYSNLPQMELLANGQSLGSILSADRFFYFDVPNSGVTQLRAISGKCEDTSLIRRVDKLNQDYVLRESGAVLNWFDITEREGCFSLNDKICDIARTEQGRAWLEGLIDEISGGKNDGMFNKNMLDMIGSFSVLRLTGMLGMKNIFFDKDKLLKMNAQLNQIKK